MSDSDDLTFKDKCAIQIVQALLTTEASQFKTISTNFLSSFELKDDSDSVYYKSRMVKLVRMAYEIADIMREERLKAFK